LSHLLKFYRVSKTNIHSLEPEDLAALTTESSALAKVTLAGTNYTVGVVNSQKI
jgi:hypothetical protein